MSAAAELRELGYGICPGCGRTTPTYKLTAAVSCGFAFDRACSCQKCRIQAGRCRGCGGDSKR